MEEATYDVEEGIKHMYPHLFSSLVIMRKVCVLEHILIFLVC